MRWKVRGSAQSKLAACRMHIWRLPDGDRHCWPFHCEFHACSPSYPQQSLPLPQALLHSPFLVPFHLMGRHNGDTCFISDDDSPCLLCALVSQGCWLKTAHPVMSRSLAACSVPEIACVHIMSFWEARPSPRNIWWAATILSQTPGYPLLRGILRLPLPLQPRVLPPCLVVQGRG